MRPEIVPARCGIPTLRWGRVFLHSSYDPRREATRFVDAALSGKGTPGATVPSVLLLLGAGMGYVSEALGRRFPGVPQIALFYTKAVFDCAIHRPAASWHPESGVPLETFLHSALAAADLSGLTLLEWPPCASACPEESRTAAAAVRRIIREISGSRTTIAAVGRLWIRNTIFNFLGTERIIVGDLCSRNRPTIIAASGPSLELCVPLLRSVASGVNLWALPSSVPVLLRRGIRPDLVVVTDPGFSSLLHLREATGRDIRIAMPLSAARGAPRAAAGIHLLEQPNFFERRLLRSAGVDSTAIPALGTVAATALELARTSCDREIVFCGLDLGYRDVQSHARFSVFDSILHERSSRLQPYDSMSYTDASDRADEKRDGYRTSFALDTYAGWFESVNQGSDPRIFRLFPSARPLPSIPAISPGELRRRVGSERRDPSTDRAFASTFPDLETRVHLVRTMLCDWARRIQLARAAGDPAKGGTWTGDLSMGDSLLRELTYFISHSRMTEIQRLRARVVTDAGRSELGERLQTMWREQSEFVDLLLSKLDRASPVHTP